MNSATLGRIGLGKPAGIELENLLRNRNVVRNRPPRWLRIEFNRSGLLRLPGRKRSDNESELGHFVVTSPNIPKFFRQFFLKFSPHLSLPVYRYYVRGRVNCPEDFLLLLPVAQGFAM